MIISLLILPSKVLAEQDVTAPNIISIEIDKNSIEAPDTVKISVEVTDDLSGVTYVTVVYYNPSESQQLYASLSKKIEIGMKVLKYLRIGFVG